MNETTQTSHTNMHFRKPKLGLHDEHPTLCDEPEFAPKDPHGAEFVTVKTSIKTDFKRLESWRGWLVERRELRDNGGEFLGNRIVHVLQGFLPLSMYNRIPCAICPNCQNVNRPQNFVLAGTECCLLLLTQHYSCILSHSTPRWPWSCEAISTFCISTTEAG